MSTLDTTRQQADLLAVQRQSVRITRENLARHMPQAHCSQCGCDLPGQRGASDCSRHGGIPARVRMIVAKECFQPMVLVDLGSRLEDDLGMDSLVKVELGMALEDEFSIVLDDREVARAKTVQQCVDLVVEKLEPRADEVRAEQRLVDAQVNQPFGGVL